MAGQHFRGLGWDNARLHGASPFQIVDPGFNAILIRASADLADLAETLGDTGIAKANRARAKKGLAAMERLWSEAHGQYLCLDRITGELVDSASVGGILPAFASIPKARAAAIAARVERLAGKARHIVPSHDPDDPRFDAKRYWRGPVWLVVNYMIADGLLAAGHAEVAKRITQSSLDLITESGFAEYYDPLTGEPLGGGRFTWTAAMVIEFLRGV
ncbi:MGH1-like glycoside hydrolase domain-containing protein [Mesorhizobium silamurunense]|uniref:MGH1-like glycoside hydrolase domain-containing protein n=1 Tax=Mesorhizobium silamurunense TaxID=499528 RepID=UPI001FEF359E|nr:trehalase family glycosidase [Mesorhizobium silamurunense]